MIRILSVALLSLTLFACGPTPNTPDGGSNGSGDASANPSDNGSGTSAGANLTVGSITKAQYLMLLDCAIARSGATAEARLAFENVKVSVNAIPDAQWNLIAASNPAFSQQLQAAVQAGCSVN